LIPVQQHDPHITVTRDKGRTIVKAATIEKLFEKLTDFFYIGMPCRHVRHSMYFALLFSDRT
jgi:hypothetical protein